MKTHVSSVLAKRELRDRVQLGLRDRLQLGVRDRAQPGVFEHVQLGVFAGENGLTERQD